MGVFCIINRTFYPLGALHMRANVCFFFVFLDWCSTPCSSYFTYDGKHYEQNRAELSTGCWQIFLGKAEEETSNGGT